MLTAILVLVASFVVARVAYDRLNIHLGIPSGAEFVLFGIVLGPQVTGVLSVSTLNSFAPIATLGLGWMGALLGSRLAMRRFRESSVRHLGAAMLVSLVTLVILSTVVATLLYLTGITSLANAALPAVTLSVVVTTSRFWFMSRDETSDVRAVPRRTGLTLGTAVHCVIALSVFGLLLAAAHPATGGRRTLSPLEWVLISIAIGVVGGVLFRLFLGDRHSGDHLFVSMIGAITLVSGAAMYLQLSPTLSAMIFGGVLVNAAGASTEIEAALDRVEQPLYHGLLILAGAEWRIPGASTVLPLALLLVLGITWKLAAARIATRTRDALPDPHADWGHRLLGTGGLALAMGLDYTYMDIHPLGPFVLTAAIAVLLVGDLLSMRRVR